MLCLVSATDTVTFGAATGCLSRFVYLLVFETGS